jgi:oligoendopeptidase F
MTHAPEHPRWRLDSLFSGLDGPDYRAARGDLDRRVTSLEARLTREAIGAGPPLATSDDEVARLAELLLELDELDARRDDVSVFLTGHTAVDAFDDAAQAEASTLRRLNARRASIEARVSAWIGRFDLERAVAANPTVAARRHFLRRAQVVARHLLGEEAEDLATALSPSGGGAWSKLRDDLAGRATACVAVPGVLEPEQASLARLRVLQADPRRPVRAAAFGAERELLDTHAVAFAAALNGVKGEVATLSERRGWASPLHLALHQNGIGPAALDALQAAVRAAFPTFRRYLRAKARFLGLDRLAWYDLLAPVHTGPERTFDWPEASDFVIRHFARFSPALEALARRASEEGWIDVPPRTGKRNGAFCMGSGGVAESRILLNFGGSLDDVFTLAHELGHAFHNDAAFRAGRRPLQMRTPMTLAETASIFCETLITNALLDEADDATRLAVLEQDLRGGAQLILDIDSRFRFEAELFTRRAERELSVAELDGIMAEAQQATYGDALDPALRHPRVWAQKVHYYSAQRSFYNFPYTFGYLFGLGVHARYGAEPEGFAARYEALLADTGMDDVADLGRSFGIDVEAPSFWNDAMGLATQRVDAYERLVDASATR